MTTVNFSGISIDEGFGTGYHLTRLIGWDDAAPVAPSLEKRPQAHGLFRPGKNWRGGRVVSVQGSWSGRSLADAYVARRRLSSLQADGEESVFAVTDPLGTTWVTAILSKEPTASDEMFSPYFEFAFDITATDPFRYGDLVTDITGLPVAGSGIVWPMNSGSGWADWGTLGDNGRVVTPNAGDADTYSSFDVAGGLGLGFILTYVPTGAQVRFDRPVPLGSVISLEPRTGRAVIDGQSDVSGFLTVSDWWPVHPGEDGSVQFTALGDITGTPTLTARTPPAIT